jgi:hypothetical protein
LNFVLKETEKGPSAGLAYTGAARATSIAQIRSHVNKRLCAVFAIIDISLLLLIFVSGLTSAGITPGMVPEKR